MPRTKRTDPESRLNSLVRERATNLQKRLDESRKRMLLNLHKKANEGIKNILHMLRQSFSLYKKLDELCKLMLEITLHPNEKSEAVIRAILENLIVKKRILPVLMAGLKATLLDLNKFYTTFGQKVREEPLPMSEIESSYEKMNDAFIRMNQIFSLIFLKSLQFVSHFEEALNKIKIVLTRL